MRKREKIKKRDMRERKRGIEGEKVGREVKEGRRGRERGRGKGGDAREEAGNGERKSE